MAKADLTAQLLRELFQYDPETGFFTRAIVPAHTRWSVGQVAGSLNKRLGYVTIAIDGFRYYTHRLAWLYMHGVWPSGEIDHINGIRNDNRAVNLRDVSRSMNAQNLHKGNAANSSKFLGVTKAAAGNGRRKTTKWVATIKVCGKRKYLGVYATPQEAHNAYVEAKRGLHEGNTL